MQETYNLQAIILKRRPFREADLKITLFTKERGKIDLVARGGKKEGSKLSAHVEPLNFSTVMAVKGKQFDYVGSAICKNSFLNIKNDLEKIKYACQAVKVFNKLIKEEEKENSALLYDLLNNYLNTVNKNNLDNQLFYYIFILKLLSELGYRPELNSCIGCGDSGIELDFFDYSKGGLVCGKCKSHRTIRFSSDAKEILNLSLDSEFKQLINLDLDSNIRIVILKIIDSFYKFQL